MVVWSLKTNFIKYVLKKATKFYLYRNQQIAINWRSNSTHATILSYSGCFVESNDIDMIV